MLLWFTGTWLKTLTSEGRHWSRNGHSSIRTGWKNICWINLNQISWKQAKETVSESLFLTPRFEIISLSIKSLLEFCRFLQPRVMQHFRMCIKHMDGNVATVRFIIFFGVPKLFWRREILLAEWNWLWTAVYRLHRILDCESRHVTNHRRESYTKPVILWSPKTADPF